MYHANSFILLVFKFRRLIWQANKHVMVSLRWTVNAYYLIQKDLFGIIMYCLNTIKVVMISLSCIFIIFIITVLLVGKVK